MHEAEEAGLDAVLVHRPITDLSALADAARYARRNDVARRALLAEQTRFPRARESRSAAFLLGRLAEDAGESDQALADYEGYLHDSPNGSFAQEALGRKLALLSLKKGDRAAAGPVAVDYLRRFPSGPYAPLARDVSPAP
jgi:TolA-binding protein